jgi:tellurite resistance protein TehA-like permease
MKRDIWVALFLLGLILFGWPLLNIFHKSLVYYLFIVWIVFIGLIFLATRSSEREDGGG